MSKLTKQFIELEIQAPITGQRFYRDEDLPGFAIRVTRNSKSYILEKRVDGTNRRITIGKCRVMSLDFAKKQACIMLGDIAKGNDPKTGRRINTLGDITLREVLQKFLEIKPIRKDTQQNYHYSINKHFNDCAVTSQQFFFDIYNTRCYTLLMRILKTKGLPKWQLMKGSPMMF